MNTAAGETVADRKLAVGRPAGKLVVKCGELILSFFPKKGFVKKQLASADPYL